MAFLSGDDNRPKGVIMHFVSREGYHRFRPKLRPTPAQTRVLDALASGKTNAQIAVELGISPETVKTHIRDMMADADFRRRDELAAWWRNSHRGAVAPKLPVWSLLRSPWFAWLVVVIGTLLAGGHWLQTRDDGKTSAEATFETAARRFDPEDSSSALPPLPTAGEFPDGTPQPFFTYRQKEYQRMPTVIISGGDLPHSITVSYAEVQMALHNDTGSDYRWYRATGLKPPDASLPHYSVRWVDLSGQSLERAPFVYVPAEPGVAETPWAGWVEVMAPLDALLKRYIALGSRGLLPAEPTLAESLSAAVEAYGLRVSVADREVDTDSAYRLLRLLGEAEAGTIARQAYGIGQVNHRWVKLEFALGPDSIVVYFFVPPSDDPRRLEKGFLVSPRFLGYWAHDPYIAPSGYSQNAFSIPPGMDETLARLDGAEVTPGIASSWRFLATDEMLGDWQVISRIEVWREGFEADKVAVKGPGAAFCAPVCRLEIPPGPFPGEALWVAVWPTGLAPFPSSMRPALYRYWLDDAVGSGSGVLLEVSGVGIRGASYGAVRVPFRVPPPLDAILRDAASRLR